MRKFFLVQIFSFVTLGPAVLAVDDGGDITSLDWSRLKVKTQGISGGDSVKPLKSLELEAWQDAYKRLEDFYAKNSHFSEIDKSALRTLIRKHTQSVNTLYYGDGSVAVVFESSLPEMLPKDKLELASDVSVDSDSSGMEPAKNSSLVIEIASGRIEPVPIFVIRSKEDDSILYSTKNVAANVFNRRLMGRWVTKKQGKSVYAAVAGNAPISIAGEASGSDILVPSGQWKAAIEGNTDLLSQAKVVVSY